MQLRERKYQSKFDRRNNTPRRIIPEYDHPPLDLRRIMFKYGPYAIAAAAAWWAIDQFVL